MSISQFPNSTPRTADEITDQIVILFKNSGPALQQDLYRITGAHFCAILEFLISSPQFLAHFDPTEVANAKTLLDSFR